MKFRSLTRHLIVIVLCVEVGLALCVTMAAIYYQRRESLRAFDIMLHGRADSVLGSVQDAEDTADNVLLDKTSIDVPSRDLYEVREENGRFLGSSGGSDQISSRLRSRENPEGSLRDDGEAHNLRLADRRYRAIVLHGVRLIDVDEPGTAPGGKGTLHHVVIYYASPTWPVHAAVWRAARFFLIADVLALLLSGAFVALLIRSSLRPLDALASQAALLSPQSWAFKAPESAYDVTELAPLASALDTALHGLKRAFEQQRTFVNDAAHELKTAVTVLKSSLQLLSFRDRTKDQYLAGIEGCLADCGRMEDLVQRMLLLARIEHTDSSSKPLDSWDISTAQILRQVVDQVESAATLRRIALRTEITGDRPARMAAEDCATLMINILMNAIQHSPAGSTIVARLIPESDSHMRFTVIDQGEGIASEHLPLIFQKFYRADASRSRHTGGTGLGLAICKAIVESSGDTIQIESELGKGTTVTVVVATATNSGITREPGAPLSATNRR
jgi:signal transduction histidine kinase